jgi:hypothetical protein
MEPFLATLMGAVLKDDLIDRAMDATRKTGIVAAKEEVYAALDRFATVKALESVEVRADALLILLMGMKSVLHTFIVVVEDGDEIEPDDPSITALALCGDDQRQANLLLAWMERSREALQGLMEGSRSSRHLRRFMGRAGQYRRPTPKVGRNDPCPCGARAKFKKCCGRPGFREEAAQPNCEIKRLGTVKRAISGLEGSKDAAVGLELGKQATLSAEPRPRIVEGVEED